MRVVLLLAAVAVAAAGCFGRELDPLVQDDYFQDADHRISDWAEGEATRTYPIQVAPGAELGIREALYVRGATLFTLFGPDGKKVHEEFLDGETMKASAAGYWLLRSAPAPGTWRLVVQHQSGEAQWVFGVYYDPPPSTAGVR